MAISELHARNDNDDLCNLMFRLWQANFVLYNNNNNNNVSVCVDMVYVSCWVHMNILSLDTERVFIQRGEEPFKQLLNRLGFKTIEVDMRNAYHLGGAFHCWTLDIRRRGTLDKYL